MTTGRNSLAAIQDEHHATKMLSSVKWASTSGLSSSINYQKEYFLSVTWEPHMNSASACCLFVVRPRPIGEKGRPGTMTHSGLSTRKEMLDGQNAMWSSIQSTTHFPETCLGKHSNAVFSVFYLSF